MYREATYITYIERDYVYPVGFDADITECNPHNTKGRERLRDMSSLAKHVDRGLQVTNLLFLIESSSQVSFSS